jgi:ABC-type multidrug transport system fused ATPase/permease subunit
MLDEPTSALDAKAERHLLESVMHMLEGRTAIVVSHRFSTVQAADRIVVLADGRLVESGTHFELVRANGAYASLFALHNNP